VEAVVKKCEGFEQVVTSDAKNPDISTVALALGKISFKKLKKNLPSAGPGGTRQR